METSPEHSGHSWSWLCRTAQPLKIAINDGDSFGGVDLFVTHFLCWHWVFTSWLTPVPHQIQFLSPWGLKNSNSKPKQNVFIYKHKDSMRMDCLRGSFSIPPSSLCPSRFQPFSCHALWASRCEPHLNTSLSGQRWSFSHTMYCLSFLSVEHKVLTICIHINCH